MMLTKDDWSRLPGRLALDVSALEPGEGDRSLAEPWSEVAREAFSTGEPVLRRLSSSTLVAAAPATLAAALDERAQAEATAFGANLCAPIYPAVEEGGPSWTMYKRWFGAARELDAGQLGAVSFANLAFAVREAVVLVRPQARYRYDDETSTLVLGDGEAELEIDVETFVFTGLMNGRLPEHLLADGLREALARLERLRSYLERVTAVQGARVRFAGSRPMLLVGDRVIVDPAGESHLAGGEAEADPAELVRDAAEDPFRTCCTCSGPRRPRVALRPRADVFSFDSERASEDEALFEPVGPSHCLVYELACDHAFSRPTRPEWEAAGWSLERCRHEWRSEPVRGRLLAVEAGSWLSRSVLVWGVEVAALAGSSDLAGSLSRRLRFSSGEAVTLYAPTANVLFVTNEQGHDERSLRDVFDQSELGSVLAYEGLPPGRPVGFLAPATASAGAPLGVELQELAVGGARPARA